MGAEEGERGEGEVRQKEGGWAGGGGERQGERLSSWIERSNACCAPERYFKKLRKVASSFLFFGWVRSAFGWGSSTCGWDPSNYFWLGPFSYFWLRPFYFGVGLL